MARPDPRVERASQKIAALLQAAMKSQKEQIRVIGPDLGKDGSAGAPAGARHHLHADGVACFGIGHVSAKKGGCRSASRWHTHLAAVAVGACNSARRLVQRG